MTPTDQDYYWTPEWQHNEADTLRELDSGHGQRFETADAAIRWLTDGQD